MYQTGTATGVLDLIDKLKIFAESQGWTTNAYSTVGTGKRLHLTKTGALCVNLRAFNNESLPGGSATPPTPDGANVYAITGNLSTGYNAAYQWYEQPGAVAGSGGLYTFSGIDRLTGAIPAYHFFAFGDCIYVIIEWSAGRFQHLGFGRLDKIGTYTGGEFYFGEYICQNSTTVARMTLMGQSAYAATPEYSAINVDVDSVPGIKLGYGSAYAPAGVARVFDSLSISDGILNSSPNSINSLAVLLPIQAFVFRDTTSAYGSSRFSPLGFFPQLFFCNVRNLIPASEISLGSDTYRVFPFTTKSSQAMNNQTPYHSGYLGLAIKSN